MNRETNLPQIPQVSDATLLDAVRAIKEILEVRTGRRGDRLDEAVTYRDLVALGLVQPTNTGGYGTVAAVDLPVTPPATADTPTTDGDTVAPYTPVTDTLDDLDALVARSPLIRSLRTRIQALENGVWVPEYINDVVTQSNSVARESRTLISRVNGNQAAVQQVMQATEGLKASYTVKVDVNGHVAGFGLAAYPNEDGRTTSEFAVCADRFIVAPAVGFSQTTTPTATATGDLWYNPQADEYRRWNGSAWVVEVVQSPFMVLTTSTTLPSGRVAPAGVYMRSAFIADLQADKITAGTITAAVSLTAAKLLGGQFTAWDWPTTAGGGFYLGPEGFKLGTYNVSIPRTSIAAGKRYRILTVGGTDFTSVGAASNTVGVTFKATGSGASLGGTGTVALESYFGVTADGSIISAPGFTIVDGVMTIDQINVIGTDQIINGAVTSRAGAALASNTADLANTLTAVSGLSVTLATGGAPVWVHADLYTGGADGVGQVVTVELFIAGSSVRSDTAGMGDWDSGSTPKANVTYGYYWTNPSAVDSVTVEIRAKRSTTGYAGYLRAKSNIFAIATKR